jgi:hypothetical protein
MLIAQYPVSTNSMKSFGWITQTKSRKSNSFIISTGGEGHIKLLTGEKDRR